MFNEQVNPGRDSELQVVGGTEVNTGFHLLCSKQDIWMGGKQDTSPVCDMKGGHHCPAEVGKWEGRRCHSSPQVGSKILQYWTL